MPIKQKQPSQKVEPNKKRCDNVVVQYRTKGVISGVNVERYFNLTYDWNRLSANRLNVTNRRFRCRMFSWGWNLSPNICFNSSNVSACVY